MLHIYDGTAYCSAKEMKMIKYVSILNTRIPQTSTLNTELSKQNQLINEDRDRTTISFFQHFLHLKLAQDSAGQGSCGTNVHSQLWLIASPMTRLTEIYTSQFCQTVLRDSTYCNLVMLQLVCTLHPTFSRKH